MSDAKNLFQKISQVMQDVEYLTKDSKIEFGTTKYKAISEEKVTTTLRASLIKNGLIILPIEQVAGRNGNVSTVNTKYKIIDIDTGQFEILASSGEGADTQDKGVGKAMTYAYKYMLLRTFAIPTGEDPDKVSSTELDEKQKIAEEKKIAVAIEEGKILLEVKAKWETLAGKMDDFPDWHVKQIANKQTNSDMNAYLAKKIQEKLKESA